MRMLLAVCALLLSCAAPASAQGWSEYRPADGRYSVDLPGRPMIRKEPVDTGKGSIDMVMAIVGVGERSFLAIYADYPDAALKGTTPEQSLINSRDGAAQGGKLLDDKALTVDGYPAREYAIRNPDGSITVARTVQAGNRLYQLLANARGAGADDPLTRRFLDSLRILPP